MAPHVQRVFGASPSAVGKLLFSAPSVSLVPTSFLVLPRVPCGPLCHLFLSSAGYSRAIRTPLAQLLFYFLTPSLFFKLTLYPRAIY